jgi:hypothetical protein
MKVGQSSLQSSVLLNGAIQLPKTSICLEVLVREGEAAGFIEDQISQELILHYIQMVSYLKSTLLLMTFQRQDLEEKYLKTGILI